MLTVEVGSDTSTLLRRQCSLGITHVFAAHVDDRLWFAAGSEAAVEIVRSRVKQSREQHSARRAPLVSLDVDVEKWLSYPQDDQVGVGGWLTAVDNHTPRLPPAPPGVVFRRRDIPPPDIRTVLTFGGDQRCTLNISTGPTGIRTQIALGEAVVNYCLARLLDYRLRWMPEHFAP